MRNGIVWNNDVANVPNVPVGTEMFWIFPSEKVCDDLRIEFLSRTPAERLAESSPTLTGNWQTKNCGTTDGLWGPAGDPIPYEENASTTTPPILTNADDTSGETGQQIFQSSQNIS